MEEKTYKTVFENFKQAAKEVFQTKDGHNEEYEMNGMIKWAAVPVSVLMKW